MDAMKKIKYLIVTFLFIIFSGCLFSAVIFAEGGAGLHNCVFGPNCPFCDLFCTEDTCICNIIIALTLVVLALLCVLIVRLVLKKERERKKLIEEEQAYLIRYQAILDEEQRKNKEQADLEAKLNGVEGYEDLVVQLAKEGDDKGAGQLIVEFLEQNNLNPGDINLEVLPPEDTNKKDEQ